MFDSMSKNVINSGEVKSDIGVKEWELIFDSVPDSVAIIDGDFNIRKVNKSMVDLLGISKERILGAKCFNLMHGRRDPPSICPHAKMLKDGNPYMAEFHEKLVDKDLIVSVTPIFDDENRVTGSVHVVRDDTKRSNAEQALKKSEKRYRSLFENMLEGYAYCKMLFDDEGKPVDWIYIDVNPVFEELTGLKDMVGKRVLEVIPDIKELEPELFEIYGRVALTGNSEAIELYFKPLNIWLDISVFSPEKEYFVAVFENITDRKISEMALKESEKKYRLISENTADVIWILELDTMRFSYVSPSVYNLRGFTAEEVLKQSLEEVVTPRSYQFISENLPNTIQAILAGDDSARVQTNRIDQRHKNGIIVHTEVVTSPLFNSEGQISQILGVSRDITERVKIEEALKESEEKFREVFNNANDSMFLHKLEGEKPSKFVEVNDTACQVLGYTREELLDLSPADIDTSKTIARIPENLERLLKNGEATFEAVQVTKAGETFPVEISAHVFHLKGEKVILSISRDISERKAAEEALKISEKKFRNIFENVQDIFYQTDIDGIITEISPSIERYSGYKPGELIGTNVENVYLDPADRNVLLETIQEKGEVVDYEVELKSKYDELLIVSTNAHFIFDSQNKPIGIEGSLRDITERKNMELALEKSLKEKEMLLKEIHHRVKNNLMIISSLLDLQSQYIRDQDDLRIFKESQSRADSMALIHERLYRSTDLKHIDFGDYIRSLTNTLYNTYVLEPSRIKLVLNVEEIMIDINTAIPLGLIVNELITNSMKHGFPEGKTGEISIGFYKKGENLFLEVHDDGVGFPDDLDFRETNSLGLQIVNSLTRQIDGDISRDRDKGTNFKIKFKETEFNK
jgi:PAS domain S-box-containing protein